MAPGSGAAVTEEGLRRGLTRFHALAIVVGSVVGTGIYLRPASIAQLVGSPLRMLLVWAVVGIFTLAGALTYAELASRLPRSGGEYVFLRASLGEFPAFMFGWMRLTVGVSSVAAMAAGVAVFLSDLIPLSGRQWQFEIPFTAVTWDLGARQIVAMLAIGVLAALNISGVARAGRFQGVVTVIKVSGLMILVALLVSAVRPGEPTTGFPTVNTATPGILAYGGALLAALAAYSGWANAAMVAGEVRDARRVLPWALIVGIGLTVVLYLAANAAYLHVLTLGEIQGSSSTAHPEAPSVASRAAATVLGTDARTALTLLLLVSALGTLHCLILAPSRVLFAMARDGLLPGRLSTVAESANTPAAAIVTLALLGSALAVLGGYDRLSNMSAFGYLIFYPLTALGLMRLRRRMPAQDDPGIFRAPRGACLSFMVGAIALLIALVARGAVEVLASLALMVLGLLVYGVIRIRGRWATPA